MGEQATGLYEEAHADIRRRIRADKLATAAPALRHAGTLAGGRSPEVRAGTTRSLGTFWTVQLAGSVDLNGTLAALAKRRPVFHSEADFQLALAWQIQLADSALRVRLETRPTAGIHLDLEVADAAGNYVTAIELKYLTRRWSGEVAGEQFNLAEHSARDIRGYDVIKDITRIEKFISARPKANGAVVVITNEAGYWRAPNRPRETNADAFRLSEGIVVSGHHHWRQSDGATAAQRPEPLKVEGRYELHWADFSMVDGSPAGTLRHLVIEVAGRDL